MSVISRLSPFISSRRKNVIKVELRPSENSRMALRKLETTLRRLVSYDQLILLIEENCVIKKKKRQ